MAEIISGSKGSAAEALANGLQVNAQILGGMVIDANGRFEAMPSYAAAAAVPADKSAFALSSSFSGSNTSVIHALNHLALQVDAANELSELDDVNFSGLSDHDAFQYDSASSKWVNAAQPEFDLASATGLPISSGVSGLAAGVADFLGTPSSANLATAVTDETGSGALVFATSPVLVTPNLGTPSAGTLTNCSGLPISSGVSGLAAGVADFLGTPSSANLATAVTDETGSGLLVFNDTPSLSTPAITGGSISGGATIDGSVIGGTTAAAGSFTTLSATGNSNFDGNVTLGDGAGDAIGVQGTMTVGTDATFGSAGSSTLIIAGKDASNANQTYKIEVVGGILRATEQ